MNCNECGGRSRVIDSRTTIGGVRRVRECRTCGHRMSTLEVFVRSTTTGPSHLSKAMRNAVVKEEAARIGKMISKELFGH